MKCEDIKELLSVYIDNEVSDAERQLVEAHLLSCADCADAVGRLRGVANAVAEMPQLKLPEAAADRLAAAVQSHLAEARPRQKREKAAPRWQWFARPAFLSVATAVGALVVAVVVWQGAANKTELKMQAPIRQGVPEAGMKQKSSGARGAPESNDFPDSSDKLMGDRDNAAPVFTKEKIDELAKTADARAYAEKSQNWGLTLGPTATNTGEALEAATRLAAGNRPATLISVDQGLFEERLVWVMVVELDEGGKRVGAAVSIEDGRLLYRSR